MQLAVRQSPLRARKTALHCAAAYSGPAWFLASQADTIREEWSTWNPQRAAAKELEDAIKAGTLTLQVCKSVYCWLLHAQGMVPEPPAQRCRL